MGAEWMDLRDAAREEGLGYQFLYQLAAYGRVPARDRMENVPPKYEGRRVLQHKTRWQVHMPSLREFLGTPAELLADPGVDVEGKDPLARVRALVRRREVPLPSRYPFGAEAIYVAGYKAAMVAVKTALREERP